MATAKKRRRGVDLTPYLENKRKAKDATAAEARILLRMAKRPRPTRTDTAKVHAPEMVARRQRQLARTVGMLPPGALNPPQMRKPRARRQAEAK
jgi:hypothetical protein